MLYKALVSFSGILQMRKGEVKAITDKEVIADLTRAGYIVEAKAEKPKAKPEPPKKTTTAKPKAKKTQPKKKSTAKK